VDGDPRLEAARLLLGVSQGLGWEVRRHLEPLLRAGGLASLLNLALLDRLVRAGECRPADLGAEFHCASSTLSESIERLVGAGLVVRLPNPEDRRSHVLAATEAGRQTLGEVRRSATRHLADALEDLDARTLAELLSGLHRVAEVLRGGAAGAWLGQVDPLRDP
jgi:DNA-binding MarR family transcriptional regulator